MNRSGQRLTWAAFVLLVSATIFLAYGPHRSESLLVVGGFVIAFAAYVVFASCVPGLDRNRLLALALGVRLLLLFAPITWTDDHFRYRWDGQCTLHGIDPFAHTPRELAALHPDVFGSEDLARLNSPDFHTAYPPVAQAVFALVAWIAGPSMEAWVVVMRLFILACELVSILLLLRLLDGVGGELRNAALYAFNPLVLVELGVNLHTEAFVIPLMLGALLLMQRRAVLSTAVLLGLAAALRLMPLVWLLALPAVLGWRRTLFTGGATAMVFVACWLPFWSEALIANFTTSLKLFDSYLEFNGGLYEGLRAALGSDAVKGTGLMRAITALGVLAFAAYAWWRQWADAAALMLWLLAIVLFGSQVVHPWYVLPLVALAPLTRSRWPLWWSLVIVPTYLTYGSEPFTQPYAWIAVEYVLLGAVIAFELRSRRSLWPRMRACQPTLEAAMRT